jgi:hypothetical protein
MAPRRNPYAPGAGTPPPELAGRDDLIERAATALDRIPDLIAPAIYSPAHGDTAFTVPLFDGFMKRIMPELPR